jgi:hypothetical protein
MGKLHMLLQMKRTLLVLVHLGDPTNILDYVHHHIQKFSFLIQNLQLE